MSNGIGWESARFQLLVTICLVAIASVAKMLGDFCREASVLLVVFIPLELWWRQPSSPGSPAQANWLGLGTAITVLFGIGVILEFVSITALRLKRDLEGSDGSEEPAAHH